MSYQVIPSGQWAFRLFGTIWLIEFAAHSFVLSPQVQQFSPYGTPAKHILFSIHCGARPHTAAPDILYTDRIWCVILSSSTFVWYPPIVHITITDIISYTGLHYSRKASVQNVTTIMTKEGATCQFSEAEFVEPEVVVVFAAVL